jgi:hypothetical protein
MDDIASLNPLATRVRTVLIAEYPEWADCLSSRGESDLEIAIPAPLGSKAGHLVIFTTRGEDLWIRFSPPHMCYSVENEIEMLAVIRQLQEETALFFVTMCGDDWIETTLIERGHQPRLQPNQIARVVSWSGKYGCTINGDILA